MMNPKDEYHLAVLSSAPISNTAEAKHKGTLLIELATKIERDVKEAQEKAEADQEETAKE